MQIVHLFVSNLVRAAGVPEEFPTLRHWRISWQDKITRLWLWHSHTHKQTHTVLALMEQSSFFYLLLLEFIQIWLMEDPRNLSQFSTIPHFDTEAAKLYHRGMKIVWSASCFVLTMRWTPQSCSQVRVTRLWRVTGDTGSLCFNSYNVYAVAFRHGGDLVCRPPNSAFRLVDGPV